MDYFAALNPQKENLSFFLRRPLHESILELRAWFIDQFPVIKTVFA